MVDLNKLESADVAPDDPAVRQAIELLFFAYRDFTSGPDAVVAQFGYGRAHHRVIHFVGRNPGITVQQLLKILRITKQSLSRVLGALIRDGYIEQIKGRRDKRLRHLHLTEQGRELEAACSAPQRRLVADAFAEAGADSVHGYTAVLKALVDQRYRAEVLDMIEKD